MITILTSVRSRPLVVVLIFISLIISGGEHLFMCLLPICMLSLEKCLYGGLIHFLLFFFILYMCLVTQSCPTPCDPMDCSPPGSSVYGILQTRILEWVAIPFSRGIFPTQELNPSLLNYRQILYCLSHSNTVAI